MKSFPKFYQGRLSRPLQRGVFPLKHLYGFKLHCSLLMYADLSWYLVAVDQALILQCNLMLGASVGLEPHLKRLTVHCTNSVREFMLHVYVSHSLVYF